MDTKTYWESQPTDLPYTLNGFSGTWNFGDHSLIPEGLRNYIFENFPKHERFNRIPLDEINSLMNEVWEGPGSMVKIERLYHELRVKRASSDSSNTVDRADVKTIDDYSDEEKSTITPSDI